MDTHTMINTQYAQRDARELGEYYTKHVQAMTAEGLHSKSAIAAELAYRDQLIDSQKEQLSRCWGRVALSPVSAHRLSTIGNS